MSSRAANLTGLRNHEFERILLVKPSSLGDIIHALPVLHGLRRRFPKARIDWLIGNAFAPILTGHTELDQLVLFERSRYANMARSPSAAWHFAKFLRRLRKTRYDLVLDLQGLFRTGFLTWATGALVRIGFADGREGSPRFYTHRLTPPSGEVHAVDRNLLVAGMLGFDDAPIEFRLQLEPDLRRQVLELLGGYWHVGDEKLVAVVPGARWDTKRWPPERFAEVIDFLQTKADAKCIILGSPDEVEVCGRVAALAQTSPLNLSGKTQLRQFAAAIALADLVLCHDSAATHLAVAFQRPLVCITGPTNAAETGPFRRGHDVVRLPLDCSPCYFRRLDQCPHGHRCMVELDAARVSSAARKALLESAPSAVEPFLEVAMTGREGQG